MSFRLPPLLGATAETLMSGLEHGNYTSVDLVKAYHERIERINPLVNAVMEVNPDATAIAEQLDEERTQGKLRGPLHGLPVLIKGNIGTRDKMQTNAGSHALQNAVLPADSTVAAKLRQAGLIILGKGSLTEWSMFRANNWGHAWNPICGQTYGAYYPRQCPGGSSGGCAVAADLGLAWATVGTETAGSIISPSERNNIVGIKPTVGLTSRYLVVPVSAHQDTVGPMARSVKDAAMLLQVLVGPDENDPYTLASPWGSRVPDYAASCKLSGLRGRRIGIAGNVIRGSPLDIAHTLAAFEQATCTMEEAGATVVPDADFTAFAEWTERSYNPVTRADFASDLVAFLQQLEHNPNKIDGVASLRAFTRHHPAEDYPARNTATWDTILEGGLGDLTRAEFDAVYQHNLYLGGEGGVLGALERHRLDAIVLPSAVAFEIAALVGTPIITVPLGQARADAPVVMEASGDAVEMAPGIPFGISFLGAKWSEETLIEIAFAFEQRSRVRESLKRSSANNLLPHQPVM
ncbi:amidase signature domain-containing protein [Nemania sp. FL0916]|nr:amidase signature domain-containing protein [Nemania sp. FL0916]